MTYPETMDRIAIIEQVSNTLFDRCLGHNTPDEATEAGLIVKLDKRNGYKLTEKGEAYLTKLLKVE